MDARKAAMPRSRQTGSRSRNISAGISSSRDAFASASSTSLAVPIE